eukprot:snap_masked-scaffold_71-processed-gene-0.47-mRNA-1 protein AED:1.00 eAED:1.00 QI:0/0/0/0/1/1/2/0/233
MNSNKLLEKEVENYRKELKSSREKIIQLEKDLLDKIGEINSLKEEKEFFLEEIHKKNNLIKEKGLNENIKLKIFSLQENIENLRTELNNKEKELKNKKQLTEVWTESIKEMEKSQEILEEENKKLRKHISETIELKKQKEGLNKSQIKTQKKKNKYKTRVKSLSEKFDALTKKLESLKIEKRILKSKLDQEQKIDNNHWAIKKLVKEQKQSAKLKAKLCLASSRISKICETIK